MSKNLAVGNEVYEYPDTGDINYGEDATGWAQDINEIVKEIRGPGDIPTTQVTLIGTSDGTHTTGDITNLLFDTAFVQRINITGFIRRTYTDATPDKVEAFNIEGVYTGSAIDYTVDYSGVDTNFEFEVFGGQFRFKYLDDPADDEVIIKYKASVQINEDFFA